MLPFRRLAVALTLAVALPATLALQLEDYRVPPVDFSRLSGAASNAYNHELLAALQLDGIVALQNVPRYAELRQEFLGAAAACAVKAQAQGAEFLLHRQLRDGTNRYTVSVESGRQLEDALADGGELLALCPEYVQLHQAFSEAVEHAVANVGSALDATQSFQVVVEGGETVMIARKLLEDSVHLDHFHAYEAPRRSLLESGDDADVNVADLSLELHTDNGLMIAMSAPEYFDVLPSGELQIKATRGEDAGLLIQTAAGEVVRPVLQEDELILMLGSGIDQWIQTSPPLHPVLHGMRYPRAISDVGDSDHQLLRAWFGKMILLEAHQVMDNTGMTYGQYANQTTRYLVQQEAEEHAAFGAVACPPQRHLAASDTSCSLKTCTLKSSASSSDLTYSCQITCNHDATTDATLCEQYCDCVDSEASGTTCWMLCVENFSSDVCPGEQECNNASLEEDLAMTCVAGTVAPSTSTSTASSTASSGSGSSSTTSTSSPSTTTATSTSASGTTTPATAGSVSASSTAGTVGSVATTDNTGDASTADSIVADETSSASASTSNSTSASSSSASGGLQVAVFVNGAAALVAVFLCMQ
ncbi:hypothetical protein BBJ28_00000420 [Nothophytophthora sp. Chile5]|nr:hypothetical protein BBJ28_00000420 [Nothophytophthora sp. Chile5]